MAPWSMTTRLILLLLRTYQKLESVFDSECCFYVEYMSQGNKCRTGDRVIDLDTNLYIIASSLAYEIDARSGVDPV